jgi:hypothetical protein
MTINYVFAAKILPPVFIFAIALLNYLPTVC